MGARDLSSPWCQGQVLEPMHGVTCFTDRAFHPFLEVSVRAEVLGDRTQTTSTPLDDTRTDQGLRVPSSSRASERFREQSGYPVTVRPSHFSSTKLMLIKVVSFRLNTSLAEFK